MTPSPWWSRIWRIGFGVVLAYELVTLRWGKPLTAVARKRALHRAGGSALVGAGLVWWAYHWLIDPGPGVGWPDALVAASGASVGYLGWIWRVYLQEDSDASEESADTDAA